MISSPHGAGVAPNLEISDADFLLTARLIRDRFGIHLTDGKRAMVASRLYRAIRELGFESYHEFAVAMLTSPTQAAAAKGTTRSAESQRRATASKRLSAVAGPEALALLRT